MLGSDDATHGGFTAFKQKKFIACSQRYYFSSFSKKIEKFDSQIFFPLSTWVFHFSVFPHSIFVNFRVLIYCIFCIAHHSSVLKAVFFLPYLRCIFYGCLFMLPPFPVVFSVTFFSSFLLFSSFYFYFHDAE